VSFAVLTSSTSFSWVLSSWHSSSKLYALVLTCPNVDLSPYLFKWTKVSRNLTSAMSQKCLPKTNNVNFSMNLPIPPMFPNLLARQQHAGAWPGDALNAAHHFFLFKNNLKFLLTIIPGFAILRMHTVKEQQHTLQKI
jgi:hypothetical protein